jgi:hypothetical protein
LPRGFFDLGLRAVVENHKDGLDLGMIAKDVDERRLLGNVGCKLGAFIFDEHLLVRVLLI